jgi:hypothetical protein
MSTSPDLVQTLSRWLAGHVSRPQLQPLVRETIEAIALGE